MENKELVDVVAVSHDSEVLWVYGPKDEANAEAAINMAIMRQGLEDRFFTTAPTGKFKAGDKFRLTNPDRAG